MSLRAPEGGVVVARIPFLSRKQTLIPGANPISSQAWPCCWLHGPMWGAVGGPGQMEEPFAGRPGMARLDWALRDTFVAGYLGQRIRAEMDGLPLHQCTCCMSRP